MIFNLDLSKQVQEAKFSRKINKLLHPTLLFNNVPLRNSLLQKNLGLTLDIKLNFSENIKNITKKNSKTMGLLRKFRKSFAKVISSHYMQNFCKKLSFIIYYHTNIICDQAYNSAFYDKLGSIQYNACLAITVAIRGTSTEKI